MDQQGHMSCADQNSATLIAIMDASVDAIIVSDVTGRILRSNPAANFMFQYEADGLIGQSVNVLMPRKFTQHHADYMERYASTGQKRIIGIGRDLQGRRKDGTEFPLHISVGEADAGGERIFVAILHDLTLRKATQDALARSQRLDAIGQMTGGIAHDFNNLLTVIIGNLELLNMRNGRTDASALVRDALDAAELGADLTSRLLVFARQSNLNPVEADLAELCQDTLAILRRTMGATYRIKAACKPGLDKVMIDPVQLQSALINLAINARDAMPQGGELLINVENVTIDDRYMAQETDMQPGRYVRISFSDDGEGMSADAQARAFEPFFTTKSDRGGTGLGLSTVYGFVRQSGGHITLYSEPGRGTSFGLYFPVSQQPKSDADPRAAYLDTELPRGKGQSVMVVEDNPKVRALSVARLRDLGYKPLEAASGDAAFQMLKAGTEADVVFSDLIMPGSLNGYDLAERVCSEFPRIKLLLTSGYASDVVSDRMKHSTSYDILHKPYRLSDLAHRLQALLGSVS
jgi:PAS domain S-box-containing protein